MTARGRHKLSALLGGLAAAMALLLTGDYALRRWARPSGYYSFSPRYGGTFRTVDDPLLGFKAAPGQRGEEIQSFDGHVLKAIYTIDRFGRRVVPGQDGTRPRPLLFFGCSFTFGLTVEDDQTLPYYVARLAPGFRVYNYGFTAWGPQNTLVLLQKTDIAAQIPEKGKAVGVFVLISDQLRRVAPTVSWLKDGSRLPYYAPGPSGRLEWKGSFGQARPLTAAFYMLLSRSGIVRHFGLDWPPISDSDFEMTARLIEESREAFKARFGSDEFYVVVYPSWPHPWEKEVAARLQSRGIRCLDYSGLDLNKELGRPSLLPNWHPVPQAYAAVARKIVGDLGLARR